MHRRMKMARWAYPSNESQTYRSKHWGSLVVMATFGLLFVGVGSARPTPPTATVGLVRIAAMLPTQCCASTTCFLWWCTCDGCTGGCNCPCKTGDCGSSCRPATNVTNSCCGFFSGTAEQTCLADNAF